MHACVSVHLEAEVGISCLPQSFYFEAGSPTKLGVNRLSYTD